jgi:hypothetical protein
MDESKIIQELMNMDFIVEIHEESGIIAEDKGRHLLIGVSKVRCSPDSIFELFELLNSQSIFNHTVTISS